MGCLVTAMVALLVDMGPREQGSRSSPLGIVRPTRSRVDGRGREIR